MTAVDKVVARILRNFDKCKQDAQLLCGYHAVTFELSSSLLKTAQKEIQEQTTKALLEKGIKVQCVYIKKADQKWDKDELYFCTYCSFFYCCIPMIGYVIPLTIHKMFRRNVHIITIFLEKN